MRRVEEVLQVGVRRVEHHADEGDGLQRRAQARHVGAERADVVGLRRGWSGRCRRRPARRVVVGVQRRHELHARSRARTTPPSPGPWSRKASTAAVVEEGAGLVLHVGARGVARVGRVLHAAVRGCPGSTARRRRTRWCRRTPAPSRRTTHVESVPSGGDRGGQAAGAGADDQQVAFDASVIALSPSGSVVRRGVEAGARHHVHQHVSRPPSTTSSAPLT